MTRHIKLQQKQADRLILTDGMRQSIKILSMSATDLSKYLEKIATKNPLVQVKKYENFRNNKNDGINFDQVKNLNMKESFYDHLTAQVSILPITKKQKNDLTRLIYKLNSRSLSECLFLQAKDDGAAEVVLMILQKNFNLLVSHNFKRIRDLYNLTIDKWEQIFSYLKGLTANPASEYQSIEEVNYIVPDAKVSVDHGGRFRLWLTRFGQPQLVFAEQTYKNLKQNSDIRTKE